MPRRDKSFIKQLWKDQPNIDHWPVHFWIDTMNLSDGANRIYFAYKRWLDSDRSTPPPNLVEWVAYYGLARYRLQDWKLPIDLSPAELIEWRKAGYYVELIDFQEALAKVTAGFLYLAGQDAQLAVDIIKKQLAEKLAELDRLASLPLDEYMPRFLEWQIRERGKKAGWSKDDIEGDVEACAEEALHMFEMRDVINLFDLRQQLQSFEWGLEKYRMLSIGEHNEDIGLPNAELFQATMQIDANNLLHQLGLIDKKLRVIWQGLAKCKCYELNNDLEPKKFWWRHWPTKPTSKPSTPRK